MINATLVAGLAMAMFAASQSTHPQTQAIAAAVLPLPEAFRSGAAVVRLDAAGHPEVLRKGTNGMVCITDKPGDAQFDVRCYHESFIPVVYRAFQLGYQVSGEKVEAEIKAGKLQLLNQPTAGYRCLGPAKGYDPSTNSVSSQVECWQSIHFPFRTAHEIGLPDETEVPDNLQRTVPYVMSSGKYWSHVMIRHPNTK
jgi:hypothetical protein